MMKKKLTIYIPRLFVQSTKVSPLAAWWTPPSNDHDGDHGEDVEDGEDDDDGEYDDNHDEDVEDGDNNGE